MTDDDSITNSKTAEKFVVRLPNGMRRRIAEVARYHRRSMNSEIVARLEQTLASNPPSLDAPPSGQNEPTSFASADEEVWAQEELERRLVALFRTLPPERQRALLVLLD
ncbi:MAG: Arc family DNA-binding protein [Pseudomonadales bacterium]|jgi:hypothetical protein|nr:Arc family DNA-binding protein [Pseudomonadales bacterium]